MPELQVRYAFCRVSQGRYADARRWAERGLAEAEAAHELEAQAQAHLVLHAVAVASGRIQGRAARGGGAAHLRAAWGPHRAGPHVEQPGLAAIGRRPLA